MSESQATHSARAERERRARGRRACEADDDNILDATDVEARIERVNVRGIINDLSRRACREPVDAESPSPLSAHPTMTKPSRRPIARQ